MKRLPPAPRDLLSTPNAFGRAALAAALSLALPACADDLGNPDAYEGTESGESPFDPEIEPVEAEFIDDEQEPVEVALRCDFDAIKGIWTAQPGSMPYEQTLVLGSGGAKDEVIGYTVFYTDSARLCAFDLTCMPSLDGRYRVKATLTDEEHTLDCAGGYYRFDHDGEDGIRMSYRLTPDAESDFAAAIFNRVDFDQADPS